MKDILPIYEQYFELQFFANGDTSILNNSIISYKLSSSSKLLSVTFECYEENIKELIESAKAVNSVHGLIYDRRGNTIVGWNVFISRFAGPDFEQDINSEKLFKLTISYELLTQGLVPPVKLIYPKSDGIK